jgi:hypothetical protein
MYGLPQSGIIAQGLPQERLAKVGYHQSKILLGLRTHKTRKICFTLVVDDFAFKYTKLEDAQHLIDALKKDYTITIDWVATYYIGLPLSGITQKERYTFTCPDTYQKPYYDSTIRNQRRSRTCHTHALHPNMELKSNTHQMPTTPPPLNKEATKYIQAVAGTLLYYGRAVNNTVLPALSAIATEQAQPMERTKETLTQLLDYCKTQEEAIITYSASK